MRPILIALLVSAISFGTAMAQQSIQPFGLTMGASAASLRASGVRLTATANKFIFHTDSVPKPHHEFESYVLLITPKAGLCKVSAIGRTHTDDVYGTELRSSFESLVAALQQKYGRGSRADFLRDGAVWSEPHDWMMSLTQNERTLEVFWPTDTLQRLSFEVESILLKAQGLSTSSGYLVLSYEGGNFDHCKSEMDAQNDAGL